jgi:hypothetical protein
VARTAHNTARQKKAFLSAYSESGNVTAAAMIAGVGRRTHYDWLDSDKQYAHDFQQAGEEAVDLLELEARRRAASGVDEPVIHQGQLMGRWVNAKGETVAPDAAGAKMIPLTIKRYSDTLLIFLMKGARPEKYRDNARVEHTGKDGGPIQTMDLSRLSDRELEDFERLASKAGGRVHAAEPGSN